MLIIKNMLKKHSIDKFVFAEYWNGKEDIVSFVVVVSPTEAYDLLNKKLISSFFYYKKPLTDFVNINDDKISSIKAKRLAKPHLTKFSVFCEEQEANKYKENNN